MLHRYTPKNTTTGTIAKDSKAFILLPITLDFEFEPSFSGVYSFLINAIIVVRNSIIIPKIIKLQNTLYKIGYLFVKIPNINSSTISPVCCTVCPPAIISPALSIPPVWI